MNSDKFYKFWKNIAIFWIVSTIVAFFIPDLITYFGDFLYKHPALVEFWYSFIQSLPYYLWIVVMIAPYLLLPIILLRLFKKYKNNENKLISTPNTSVGSNPKKFSFLRFLKLFVLVFLALVIVSATLGTLLE